MVTSNWRAGPPSGLAIRCWSPEKPGDCLSGIIGERKDTDRAWCGGIWECMRLGADGHAQFGNMQISKAWQYYDMCSTLQSFSEA